MPTGADIFVDAAKRLGISHIFTLVGDHLNEVLTVAAAAGMTIIDMRHESGVTHAADAWARITRKPAISLVTGGPGHTNSLTGIATAFLAASPVITVSGSPSTLMKDRVVFQDIDQVSMTVPVVKWAAQPSNGAQIPFFLGRAYAEATAGRMGPVHLTIPVDLFAAEVGNPLAVPVPPPRTQHAPAAGDVERALDLLRRAERPVVIAGSGLWWADAGKELQQFIKKTKLPCYTITMARGILNDRSNLSYGYADPALNKAVHQVFREADVCLVLGKRIDYRLALGGPRLFSPAARFIQVDVHGAELGRTRQLELGICADVKATLRAMRDSIGTKVWAAKSWSQQARVANRRWQNELDRIAREGGSPLHPAAFFAELRKHLPKGTLLSWDGGDFVHWGRIMIPAEIPGGWLRLGPMGTIGSALPNAIALKLAKPEAPVVMITGDGSLGFYIAELDTAVRYKLPFVTIVGNDGGWGLERELQSELNGEGATVACELRRTRYDVVMKGFGGAGETVDRVDQIGPAMKRAFESKLPYLVNVNIRGARSPFTEWQIAGKAKPAAK